MRIHNLSYNLETLFDTNLIFEADIKVGSTNVEPNIIYISYKIM